MANYQDYNGPSYLPDKDDIYRPRSSGLGILIAVGILAAIVLGLLMLGGTNTAGLKDLPAASGIETPAQPNIAPNVDGTATDGNTTGAN